MQIKFSDALALFVYARRTAAGQTQVEFAATIGCTDRQVRAAENKHRLTKGVLRRMAGAMELGAVLDAVGGQQYAVLAPAHHAPRLVAVPATGEGAAL